MYRADAAAVAAGVSGERLMEAAGWAVARAIRGRWSPRRVAVLCGPGNNGGDGFVVARLLERAGWPVRLALLGACERLNGDAARMAGRWPGEVLAARPEVLDGCGLVVDALFGAGLARPLDGAALDLVRATARHDAPCVAIDVPSGVHGDSGAVMGAAAPAALTVTFFRRKPGHLLLPGREQCGEVVVADIGIPERVLDAIAPTLHENHPDLWRNRFPRPGPESHKYSRGHLVVVGGGRLSGAARLAARAARRVGAGLVTVAVPAETLPVVASDAPGNLVAALEEFDSLIADHRRNAFVIGPGSGVGEFTRQRVLAALGAGKACVLDADAVTSFAAGRDVLFRALSGRPVLLTPHDGEYRRLFAHRGSRLEQAMAAARECGAVVVLKGNDTVIAAPDGRAAVNANAPADLATAGTGDVLAGLAGGLLALGMDAFDAGCAAVWLQGAAAARLGRGLIAEDLPEALPAVLSELDQGPGGYSGRPGCRSGGGAAMISARPGGRRWTI